MASSQYSETTYSGGNSSGYSTLTGYYNNLPLVATGVTVEELQPGSRAYLNSLRTINVKSQPPMRTGYGTLSGSSVSAGDYFTLDTGYQSR